LAPQPAESVLPRGARNAETRIATCRNYSKARAREIASEKQARSSSEALSSSRTQIVQSERDRSIALALQELAALHARETSRGIELTLSDVYFEFDRADLRPSAAQDLTALAAFLRENPGRAIVIEGHTDSVGSETYNLDLSRRRAAAVQSFLVAQGVDPTRISARGFGKSYPVASNDSESGRQQNRRVDMLVLNPGTEVSLSTAPIISR